MNVLSLFDGGSCGQLALQRAGVKVDKYYASEIDKYAIKVANKNFPDTIQVGDVKSLLGIGNIDLLIGGSPCQGFSVAGEGLNFDDPRSALFFEFVRLLKSIKPKYFFLENVIMKQEYQDIITEQLFIAQNGKDWERHFFGDGDIFKNKKTGETKEGGCIRVNSSLMSAQNRQRLYWTNIPLPTFKDKGIVISDITDSNAKGAALRGQQTKKGIEKQLNIRKDEKSNAIVASYHDKVNGVIELLPCDEFTPQKESLCKQVATARVKGHDLLKRVYCPSGKSPTLDTMQGGGREPKILAKKWFYRPLNINEMERLQTLPTGYTDAGISNTQRKKIIGNGWTVDIVAEFFKNMK